MGGNIIFMPPPVCLVCITTKETHRWGYANDLTARGQALHCWSRAGGQVAKQHSEAMMYSVIDVPRSPSSYHLIMHG